MYRFVTNLAQITGAVLITISLVPIYVLMTGYKLGCSDALGFSFLVGGLFLIIATFVIDKYNKRLLYIFLSLIITLIIMGGTEYLIQWLYGVAGQFDVCTIFIG